MRSFSWMVVLVLALSLPAAAAEKTYFFPYVNAYEATVMESPPAYHAKLPKKVPTRTFKVKPFPDRKVPDVFWYDDGGLKCSLVYQDHKAPLVFLIAGTGGRYDTPKNINLQKALYQAGFHVIAISSPTHMDFIINASRYSLPGQLYEDARDLYRVMELAWDKVKDDIEVTEFHLTGYSLGGIDSAYVSLLDEERKVFNFERVLLINPPVKLFNSVSILDRMLPDNIPGGIENFDVWFDDVMKEFARIYEKMGYADFSGDYLYKVYKRFPPHEDFLAALIGLSFRMSSRDMIFTSDIMRGGGYITPSHAEFDNSTALTPYAMVGVRTGFVDYFREYFYPIFHAQDPSLTEEELANRLSLMQIEPYLRSATKIHLLGNEDDIILAPGEVDYLKKVFGKRAQIYPTGGHCGNMNHPDVVRFITGFFSGREG